jgi:hypothetical protein
MRKRNFTPIPTGTPVSWVYRSGEGHGYITGVHKAGTAAANTEYSVRQVDMHVGEPSTVYHYGSDITRSTASAVQAAAKQAKARS